jgi:hypothetical protein
MRSRSRFMMWKSRKTVAVAAVALVGAGSAAWSGHSSPARGADSPHVGVGVSGGLIGDLPGTTGYYPPPYGEFGNDPLTPGQSWTGTATFVSTGNVAERIGIAQQGPATVNGKIPAPPLPSSWISLTAAGAPDDILKPGQKAQVTIKVTVPADAVTLPYSPPNTRTINGVSVVATPPASGVYWGALTAVASPVSPTPGVSNVYSGAGIGEYVRVVPANGIQPVNQPLIVWSKGTATPQPGGPAVYQHAVYGIVSNVNLAGTKNFKVTFNTTFGAVTATGSAAANSNVVVGPLPIGPQYKSAADLAASNFTISATVATTP